MSYDGEIIESDLTFKSLTESMILYEYNLPVPSYSATKQASLFRFLLGITQDGEIYCCLSQQIEISRGSFRMRCSWA